MNEATAKGGSLTSRVFWLVFAKTLAFIFSFALPLLLVRRLSQTDYGLFKQAFLIASTASGILPLGFSTSAFYYLPRERERRGAIIFNILLFNCAVGGLACGVFLFYPALLEAIFNSPALVEYAPLIGLLVLLWIVSYLLEIVSIANSESRLSAIVIIGAQLSKTALMLGAAIAFASLRALLYAALIQSALQTVLMLYYLRARFGRFWREFDLSLMRAQLSYGLPLGLAALLAITLTDAHNYFVSYRFGPAAFALYSVGCFSLPLVGILIESIGSVMITRVSQLQKEMRTREIVLLTSRAMRKLAVVYFPLYAFLLVVGREFMIFLFTEQYAGSWPIFMINLTTLPFLILLVDPIMRSYAEHRFFFLKTRAVMVLILLVALWFGTGYLGLIGAITVVVAINLLNRLVETFKAWKIINVRWRDITLLKDVGKIAVASIAAGALAAAARLFVLGARPFVVLTVCGAVFACAYLACVWLLKVPTTEEREAVRSKILSAQRRFWWRRAADPLV